ncbi:MAG: glycosyl hydrolase family 28-related protein, partial [Acidobacteriota bacterium]
MRTACCVLAACLPGLGWQAPASINVRDLGAAGNGRADDTAAIQAALDAYPGQATTIQFPPGRYKLTAPLRAYRTQHLNGVAGTIT